MKGFITLSIAGGSTPTKTYINVQNICFMRPVGKYVNIFFGGGSTDNYVSVNESIEEIFNLIQASL